MQLNHPLLPFQPNRPKVITHKKKKKKKNI
jgi:hypothetical protein